MASTARPRRSWKKILLWVIGIAVVVFIAIQFVPYGRSSHSNPPAANPFQWTDPQAEAIAKESCYDCHSNETKWWWATNIAPFSWLVQRDVDEGRSRLNFSDWNNMPAAAIQEIVNEGEMPPFQYTLIHPGAKLTDAEKQTLVQGYEAGVAASSGSSSETPTQSSPTPTPTATAATDAVAIINQRCSTCHSADPALSFRAGGTAEATALVDDMIQRGAQVTAAEKQTLVQYFTQ
jgi:hypothetical protein